MDKNINKNRSVNDELKSNSDLREGEMIEHVKLVIPERGDAIQAPILISSSTRSRYG